MAPGFTIDEERSGAGHKLALKGELDLAAAYDLETALSRLCGPGGQIELDLRGITFMDSMGMRSLLTARDMCSETGSQLVVIAGEGQRKMLEVTGLIDILPLHGDDAPTT
jgi:anti-anti-sigma factor